MPLVRVEVRNEYGLGMPELYTETNREDPKAVLDGVAVAGLVGILRQLGDLAEFAAEVFHGLQEQVLITSSRSHKLVERVHNIEAALPPLEKAILAQRTHLHFAYTAGSHWHTRIKAEQNHFIYSDLPRCIMDAYEDCRDPPRLHKLDKYDIGGPGSCFRRYSDPTYFKRSSSGPYETHLQNVPREKKARRNKKKKSSRYRDVTHDVPVITGRKDFGSTNFKDKASPSQDIPTFHVPQTSSIEPEIDHLTSFESTNGLGYIDCIFRPSYSTQSEDNNNLKEPSSNSYLNSPSLDDNNGVRFENIHNSYVPEDSSSRSPYITWDEKLEIIDSSGRPTEKLDTGRKTEPVPTSISTRGQPDEIESETDYYLDALNTIESESETDIDCQTKRELKQYNNTNNEDDRSANFEFHVPELTSSSKSPNSHTEDHVFSNNEGVIESDRVENGGQANSVSVNTPEKCESEEVETVVTNLANVESEKVETPGTNATIESEGIETPDRNLETVQFPLTTHVSPEPSPETSIGQTTVNQPVMFWTNGRLLGLEPSKPPDFGLPRGPVEETKTAETQKTTINEETVVDTSKSEENVNSSRIFEFSNRLLVNGFRRQISLVGNEALANSVKSEVPENTPMQKRQQTVSGIPFREQFGNGTSFISPSSPPLEHMRISFQPIDGFETSKLKLMFPDGSNNNNESSGYGHMFPSFQLVPEPGISLHDSGSGSDSDDDTFCRSSPYASDDGHSHASESNSDQWDSGDSPGMKNHELDDAFGRISSAESASSSHVNGIRFPDIPNFDSMNGLHNQVNESCPPKEPTPLPPPLPPMEWRGVKQDSNVMMEKEDGLSEALTFALSQPKLAPVKQDHFVEKVDFMPKPKQPDWQNLHVQSESNRKANGKKVDEKEDFLQQIRTKSRNLRRTSTAPATITPAGPTGVKVTAILEKANAIRQAVGSDDGEDNWSDT